MIESGSRGLNPFQPATAYDLRPRNGHFRVTAEDVRFEQLLGNPILPRIDDLMPRRSGADVVVMALFEGVAEDDAHNFSLTKGILAISVAARGVAREPFIYDF